jgi:hypothetical protein
MYRGQRLSPLTICIWRRRQTKLEFPGGRVKASVVRVAAAVPKSKNSDTEVVASSEHDRRQRRRFSAEYKERILREADACTERDARSRCDDFFGWYNVRHHHDSLALFTPEQVFAGRVERIAACRKDALDAAYRRGTLSASLPAHLRPHGRRNA